MDELKTAHMKRDIKNRVFTSIEELQSDNIYINYLAKRTQVFNATALATSKSVDQVIFEDAIFLMHNEKEYKSNENAIQRLLNWRSTIDTLLKIQDREVVAETTDVGIGYYTVYKMGQANVYQMMRLLAKFKKLVTFKKSKYQRAMVLSGMISEEDVKSILSMDIEAQKAITGAKQRELN